MKISNVLGGLALLALGGCSPHIGGLASFPVLSMSPLAGYEKVADVDEKRCSHVVLFIGWGDDPNHEALITDLIQHHKGDAIANAELTFFSIPAIVYNQRCAQVRGTIVRKVGQ